MPDRTESKEINWLHSVRDISLLSLDLHAHLRLQGALARPDVFLRPTGHSLLHLSDLDLTRIGAAGMIPIKSTNRSFC